MSFRLVLIRDLVHFPVFSFPVLLGTFTLSLSCLAFAHVSQCQGIIHFLQFIHLGIKDTPPQESIHILEGWCVR